MSATTDLYDSQLRELCVVLGWQGGTYHQVLGEVKRLTKISGAVDALIAENKRLEERLQFEQHRAGREKTHAPGCFRWGPAHYECALRELDQRRPEFPTDKENT